MSFPIGRANCAQNNDNIYLKWKLLPHSASGVAWSCGNLWHSRAFVDGSVQKSTPFLIHTVTKVVLLSLTQINFIALLPPAPLHSCSRCIPCNNSPGRCRRWTPAFNIFVSSIPEYSKLLIYAQVLNWISVDLGVLPIPRTVN